MKSVILFTRILPELRPVRLLSILLSLVIFPSSLLSEDGYDLWLRYHKIEDPMLLQAYTRNINYVVSEESDPVLEAARSELERGIRGLLGIPLPHSGSISTDGALVLGTAGSSVFADTEELQGRTSQLGEEGYTLFCTTLDDRECLVIMASGSKGVLYGVFHLLRLIQTGQPISGLDIIESPRVKIRMLNHWDNLDRTVERGYAGFSIWDWHKLPGYISRRYTDYARANASIGINGTVLTNVNANAFVLTHAYLEKVAALADVFRPYGIKVYLTARFNAPVELGGTQNADPLDPDVIEWWQSKAAEIYELIPDFGGFLVKANSEGQPGPQDYNRSHAEGANMLADAIGRYGGVVLWRAFVYDHEVPEDRAKQAYNEFVPLDGTFRDNVIIQVKNGPIDFQPREPFHPLFGAMPRSVLGVEFQITQEYLGQGTHLVYLAPLFKECLDADTYSKGKGSPVSGIIDGSLYNSRLSCMAGVSNIGTDRNWTGHHFGQANWYAFGRLAWDHRLSPEQIAGEWIQMTFTTDEQFCRDVSRIMMRSREITVKYMTPLGLHHIMGRGHHYGPAPWINQGRADWTSVYYHKAGPDGIGFDRTITGSNSLGQYSKEVRDYYSDLSSCPDEYLLWFHHLSWDHKMRSGKTLWDELCFTYYEAADSVGWMMEVWDRQRGKIDNDRFEHTASHLSIQSQETQWWRDACLLYFQTFSGFPLPESFERPAKTLEYFMNLRFPYAPGIRPDW